ncbi:MAG: hypothetical protein R3A46_08110 [Thermomicrobiales bacterium]
MINRFPRVLVPAGAALVLLVAALAVPLLGVGAEEPATSEFSRTWERTDKPVADLEVNRTWIWGPTGMTDGIMEPYAEAAGGQRLVQYYQKARMEIPTDPAVGQNSPWYVTTGLLPIELMTGNLQLGDTLFQQYPPADINIAGDPTDESAPSYAEMAGLMSAPAVPVGQAIDATVDQDGQPGVDDRFAGYGVTGSHFVAETSHTIASPFWDFMNASGTIWTNGGLSQGPLFQDPFFGFGYPVTEAYWSTIELNGQPTDILIQVFERRVATYTPDNPDGWKVETGNVGQHYYEWRYEIINADEAGPLPTSTPTAEATEPPSASATETPAGSPTATTPANCLSCRLDVGRGEIGEAGPEPLGQEAFSSLSLPYLEVPGAPNDTIDKVVVGTNGVAQLYFPDTMSVVSDWSPSDTVYYVADFNDGSVYVSGVMPAHIGLNITHVYNGRGEFHVKVWAVDPESNVRTPVAEALTVVE